jgi:hypothetical protein
MNLLLSHFPLLMRFIDGIGRLNWELLFVVVIDCRG